MDTLSVVDLRNNTSDTINRVAYGGERVILERRGKPAVAIVSMEDLEALVEMENQADIKAARKARKQGGKPIPLENVAVELGIKTKTRRAAKRRTG